MARLFKEAVPRGNATWSAMGKQHMRAKKKFILLNGKEFSKGCFLVYSFSVFIIFFKFVRTVFNLFIYSQFYIRIVFLNIVLKSFEPISLPNSFVSRFDK